MSSYGVVMSFVGIYSVLDHVPIALRTDGHSNVAGETCRCRGRQDTGYHELPTNDATRDRASRYPVEYIRRRMYHNDAGFCRASYDRPRQPLKQELLILSRPRRKPRHNNEQRDHDDRHPRRREDIVIARRVHEVCLPANLRRYIAFDVIGKTRVQAQRHIAGLKLRARERRLEHLAGFDLPLVGRQHAEEAARGGLRRGVERGGETVADDVVDVGDGQGLCEVAPTVGLEIRTFRGWR